MLCYFSSNESLFVNLLGSSPLCTHDFVAVYDGQTDSSRRIGKFCATFIPPVLLSSSDILLVKFHSDFQRGYPGFIARWESRAVTIKPTIRTPGEVRKNKPHGTRLM